MNQKLLNVNTLKLLKHRNTAVALCGFLLISNILLCAYILTSDKKIVLVPGIKEAMEISDTSVSSSYIQGMTDMFLSNLLDLNESNVLFRKDTILKNTTANSFRELSNYFDKQAEDITKFKISTYFTPRSWRINEKKLTVSVDGVLTSRFGVDGKEESELTIDLRFIYQGGVLKLAEFIPSNNKKIN